MKRRYMILAVALWCTAVTAPAAASPLYGGYNGESILWFDAFFFGADNQGRWWIRVPVDIVPGSVRTIFKLESGGVLSAEIALYNIPGQDSFLFGIDSAGMSWGEIYQGVSLAGNASGGSSWTEQTIFEVLGAGADNKGNVWWSVTFPYQNAFPVTLGLNITAFLPEPPVEAADAGQKERSMLPLRAVDRGKVLTLMSYVSAISRDNRLAEGLVLQGFHPRALLAFAENEVFPQERREALEIMMRGLTGEESEL